MSEMVEIPICEVSVEAGWEAAHWLPGVPEGHKCRRMHGHSYRARVTLRGPVDAGTGMVVDFSEPKSVLRALTGSLDHQVMNDAVENPTVENLAVWLWGSLSLAPFGGSLAEVRVWEGESNTAAYRGHVGFKVAE
jgi:6-pyruvoyltetrahydropterin/6-carboxytetrahydropterin synthase